MRKAAKPDSGARLTLYHALLLGAWFVLWYGLTTPGIVSEEFAKNTAFFFGKPLEVLKVIWEWFAGGKIYSHLGITLVETLLAFCAGSVLGLLIGLWLALSPTVLANARMLGASKRQLLRHLYLPPATSWVFSSLHTAVGMAFVGAVVGEYLGSAKGVGYLILQAEGVFDINTVFAGILVLTGCETDAL